MQKTIHGADDVITSSKSSPKERPPVLEEDEDLLDVDADSESESEVTGAGSKESDDGLSWLDGSPPKLGNVERRIFSIEDTVDLGSSYLLDLLDSTPIIPARSHPTSRPKAHAPPLACSKGQGLGCLVTNICANEPLHLIHPEIDR